MFDVFLVSVFSFRSVVCRCVVFLADLFVVVFGEGFLVLGGLTLLRALPSLYLLSFFLFPSFRALCRSGCSCGDLLCSALCVSSCFVCPNPRERGGVVVFVFFWGCCVFDFCVVFLALFFFQRMFSHPSKFDFIFFWLSIRLLSFILAMGLWFFVSV